MAFTNSSLVNVTRISPNRNSPRNNTIKKIVIHHMAGVCSIEQFGNIVANPAREMSANYAIGNDGRIILTCPESDRSWCSSSGLIDNQAITIEVSNSAYGDASGWPVSEAAYNSLIKLCVDICKRNGIKKLEYINGSTAGTLVRHCDIVPTACPGPWIKAHTQDICNKVNAQLNVTQSAPTSKPTQTPSTSSFKTGDLVSINNGARYYNGGGIPNWVVAEKWYISSISGDRAVLGLNEIKNRNIQSPINTKDITLVTAKVNTYTKSLKSSDLLYDTAGGKVIGTVGATGVFTIVEDKNINGVVYGKLKSGVGWVICYNNSTIKVGALVSLKSDAVYYNGSNIPTWVKSQKWYVSEISEDRAVLGQNEQRNQNIQSPINTKYLY